MKSPRIAIVSDALVQRGGAERVVETIAQIFPEAPVYALLYSAESGPASIRDRVVASPLNRIPGATKRHRWLFPLYPAAIESFDLGAYDVIISSHHTVAKGVLRNGNQYHLSYCHTPSRALWEGSLEGRSLLSTPVAQKLLRNLRVWDYAAAAHVDDFVANSETTRRRIAKHYGRDSRVLSPPIDTERFRPAMRTIGDYYLVASRLVPYKRVDLAVAATGVLGRRLVVVGAGPGERDVRQPHVDYRGHVTDAELVELMQGARAMIFPGFEDFGMAPVEMMACGRPVVAFGRGGARETVVDGRTGVLSQEQTVEAFVDALQRFEAMTFDSDDIRRHAENYSVEHFTRCLRTFVDDGYRNLLATL
ncbi:MAG: glycosyltransferase family 4 protein [Candidatus Velthaea sp.]